MAIDPAPALHPGTPVVPDPAATAVPRPHVRPLARRALLAFLLVFIAARVLVIAIMAGRVPDLFLHLGKGNTHVHHLNYGILLLSTVGAATLFLGLNEAGRRRAAWAYGAGMALTFDEFGMWLHLGGSYWQRASYDGVVVVAIFLASFAFAPPRARWHGRHTAAALLTAAATLGFGLLLYGSLNLADRRLGPRLEGLEERGPR